MLELKRILSGEVTEIPFCFEYDLSALSADIVCGVCKAEGKCTSHAGFIVFNAAYRLNYTAVCASCGEEFQGEDSFEFSSPIAEKLENTDKDQDEYLILQDGCLDTDGINESMIILNLPSRFVCREDCKGVCPGCGINLNKGVCSCPKKRTDPRLEKMKQYFNK